MKKVNSAPSRPMSRHRSQRWLAAMLLTTASLPIWGQSANLTLPFGNLPSGQDRIRSADGVECQTHVGPRNRWMDMGVYSMGTQSNTTITDPTNSRGQYMGVYARITINLDPVHPTIDCSRLYQLEIDRLRREIDDLQMTSKVSVQPR